MLKKDYWIYKVFLLTFFLSLIFSGVSNIISSMFNEWILGILIILVILIGIIFDIIGVSVLTSNKSTFHAKATRKVKGAKESITLINNSTKIASICNDVIGDICGILSGGLGTVFVIVIIAKTNFNLSITTIILTAIISSLTVGGKAIGKKIAIANCDEIVFIVGKLKNFFKIK